MNETEEVGLEASSVEAVGVTGGVLVGLAVVEQIVLVEYWIPRRSIEKQSQSMYKPLQRYLRCTDIVRHTFDGNRSPQKSAPRCTREDVRMGMGSLREFRS
mmetsp:Transcript_42105/g.80561  ORF Transcript_42105/g.80561 Transcript_42105/m.80561 type:complete len:101 (-) Transcript_42105:186-488(-)